MKTLETARLILRDWQNNDASDLYDYAKSPKVGPMAGWKPHDTLEESKEILAMFQREKETWALEEKNSHKVIGSIGLHHRIKETLGECIEIGYVLSESYWGQGLMPEAVKRVLSFAFLEQGIDRIFVCHFPNNEQSKRVIQKLGFTFLMKTEQSYRSFDGTYLDELVYEMTKKDFLKYDQQ